MIIESCPWTSSSGASHLLKRDDLDVSDLSMVMSPVMLVLIFTAIGMVMKAILLLVTCVLIIDNSI